MIELYLYSNFLMNNLSPIRKICSRGAIWLKFFKCVVLLSDMSFIKYFNTISNSSKKSKTDLFVFEIIGFKISCIVLSKFTIACQVGVDGKETNTLHAIVPNCCHGRIDSRKNKLFSVYSFLCDMQIIRVKNRKLSKIITVSLN